jgi:E3 ubiquitin-protein ligase RNF144
MDCGHHHCRDCLQRNAQSALVNKPFTPARCCTVIAVDVFVRAGALEDTEKKLYETLIEEHGTLQNKIYCYSCKGFISKADWGSKRIAICKKCNKNTCRKCGVKSHFGKCEEDVLAANNATSEAVIALASAKKWKKCPNCAQLIERDRGCNHML